MNVEVPSPTNGILGSIAVKEGETVNVGSLLGVVDSSSAKTDKTVKEVNNYTPPKKANEKEEYLDAKLPSFHEVKKEKNVRRMHSQKLVS